MTSTDPKPCMSVAEVAAFLDEAFPAATRPDFGEVVSIGPMHARLRLAPTAAMIRPGELVSGPAQMGLVDVAAYAVILAHVGPIAMAVTSTLTIHFLRGCRRAPLVADARLLKLGRRLATVDVRLWQDDETRITAQATVGYALP